MSEPLEQLRTLGTQRLADPVGIADLQGRIRRRRRHHRLLAGLAVSGFAAVVLGSLVLLGSEDGTAPVVTPAPEVTTSTINDAFGSPSQSDSDAARDGVLHVIAQAPISVRVDNRAEIETPEGRWVLSRATQDLEQLKAPGVCFDSQGTAPWKVTEGCLLGYGEILLLDHEGQIERAYPMPGIPPTWIVAADRYIYAGRQGDGGIPNSSVVRIDRVDLTAEVATFRFDDASAPDQPSIATWYEFGSPQHGRIEAILDPPAGTGTPVTSWTNPNLRIDPGAVDALFATLPH
jgi:hypothetical protein